MSTDLEHLVQHLAAQTSQAQQIWEAEYRSNEAHAVDDDETFDFDGAYRMWLGLHHNGDGSWTCGWLMQPDEIAGFVLSAVGRTPSAAAQALMALMQSKTNNT